MGVFRLILAISVLIAHSTPIFGITLVGGRVAVESFLMISGFYMALILTTKYQSNIQLFYKNRFLKLFPIYWLFTILVIVSSFVTTGKFTIFKNYLISPLSKIILIFFNLSPLFNDVTNFLGVNIQTGNMFFTTSFRNTIPEIWNYLILPQGWTIGLEISFYFIAPWLIKQKNKTLFFVGAISLILRLYSYYFMGLNHDPWEYRFFPFELLFFILGIFAYRFYNKFTLKPTLFIIIPIFILTFIYQIFSNYIIYYLAVFISLPFLFKYTKDSKLDRLIGELSYPLYLCHFLIIDIFAQTIKVNHQYLGLYSLLLSIPVAFLSYNLVNGIIKRD